MVEINFTSLLVLIYMRFLNWSVCKTFHLLLGSLVVCVMSKKHLQSLPSSNHTEVTSPIHDHTCFLTLLALLYTRVKLLNIELGFDLVLFFSFTKAHPSDSIFLSDCLYTTSAQISHIQQNFYTTLCKKCEFLKFHIHLCDPIKKIKSPFSNKKLCTFLSIFGIHLYRFKS